MSENISTREVIELLVKQAGIRKKMAAEILRVIPAIIEEGLKRDGEVRVKGLGIFRLKPVKARRGRNPKTGERVEIPAHNRVVFLPEVSMKEFINRDYRLLSYKIIPEEGQEPVYEQKIPEPLPTPEPEPIIQSQPEPEPEPIIQSQPEPEPEPILPSQPEPKPEPEPPMRKSRIHWIVPLAFSIIIILGLIFYFRNCNRVEDKSQKSEVSEQPVLKPAQPEATAAEDSQTEEVVSQETLVSSPLPDSLPQIGGKTGWGSNSTLKTISEGDHLFQLALEAYGNPYLWVLIYRENKDKIIDPDLVVSGKELSIPALEGSADHLTRNDSIAVSEGYRLVYEFYKAKNDPRIDDFLAAFERYKPL